MLILVSHEKMIVFGYYADLSASEMVVVQVQKLKYVRDYHTQHRLFVLVFTQTVCLSERTINYFYHIL